MSGRAAKMPFCKADSSLIRAGSAVFCGQVEMAPSSESSAFCTALAGKASTKFAAVVQSTWPLARMETAGLIPLEISSASRCAPC